MHLENEISFLFSTPKRKIWSPLSFIIRWSEFKKSKRPFRIFGLYPSSHVAIKLDNFVFEAVFLLGIRKITFSKWASLNQINEAKTYILDPDKKLEIESYLEGSIGIPYPNVEIIGISLQRIWFFLTNQQVPNPFKTITRKIKCCELGYIIWKKIFNYDPKIDENSIGVRQFRELL
jgi:hypothetical protein